MKVCICTSSGVQFTTRSTNARFYKCWSTTNEFATTVDLEVCLNQSQAQYKAKGIVPFPCHVNCKTHQLLLAYVFHSQPLEQHQLFTILQIPCRWQRHLRDSQLWTNAKPMHGVHKRSCYNGSWKVYLHQG